MMHLLIDSRLTEIRRAGELIDEFKARYKLGDEDADALHIVLDELLSNTIRHGLAGSGAHRISVGLDLQGDEIVIEVEDDGAEFDPTQGEAPVLPDSLEERRDGGLGVVFVRALTHAMEYRRAEGRNRLVLRRRVVPA